MDHVDAKALFRRYVSVWESGHLNLLDTILHERYVGHPSWGDRNVAELRLRILDFRSRYPDVRFSVEDQIAADDKVASRMVATATDASDGHQVVLTGLNLSRIEDGRIVEEWMAWEVQDADTP